VGVGESGYVAAMEWRSVQLERPSSTTSGGQSVGGGLGAVFFLEAWDMRAEKADRSLQARQLGGKGVRRPVMRRGWAEGNVRFAVWS
jgi:hypothetical protein